MDMTDDIEALKEPIAEIMAEYESLTGPFEELPELNAIYGIDGEVDRATFLTLTVSIDYRRNARRLWSNSRDLWDTERWIFRPDVLTKKKTVDDLFEVFNEHGMRFPRQDAEIWYTNSESFRKRFDSNPLSLFRENEDDAEKILQYVRKSGRFPYLGGKKIGPLWMRLIHQSVRELSNIGEMAIPVDVNIRKTTYAILGAEYSDDEIRSFWAEFCDGNDVDPVKVDPALWEIGSKFDLWGEEYLTSKIGQIESNSADRAEVPRRADYDNYDQWIGAVATGVNIEESILREVIEQSQVE